MESFERCSICSQVCSSSLILFRATLVGSLTLLTFFKVFRSSWYSFLPLLVGTRCPHLHRFVQTVLNEIHKRQHFSSVMRSVAVQLDWLQKSWNYIQCISSLLSDKQHRIDRNRDFGFRIVHDHQSFVHRVRRRAIPATSFHSQWKTWVGADADATTLLRVPDSYSFGVRELWPLIGKQVHFNRSTWGVLGIIHSHKK